MRVCMYVRMYVLCMHVCMYACMYVCMYHAAQPYISEDLNLKAVAVNIAMFISAHKPFQLLVK